MNSLSDDNSLRQKLVSSIVLLTISKAFAQLLFFIVRYVLLINWLTPNELAEIIVFFRYLELLQSLVIIGPFVLPKFIAEKKYPLNNLLSNVIIIILINVLFIFIGFLIFIFFIKPSDLNEQTATIFIITLFLGEITIISQKLLEWLFLGLKKPKRIFFSNMILSIAYIVLSSIFILVFSLAYLGGIIAYILSLFCSFIYQYYCLHKSQQFQIKWRLEKVIVKDIIIFSFPLFLSGLFYFINYRVNSLFLKNIDINLLIYYDTGISLIIFLIGFIGIPIQDAIFPYISKTINENNYSETKQIFSDTSKIISLFFFSILLSFYILVDFIYPLLYPSFNDPFFYEITRFLILGGFFYILNQFYGRISAAKGKTYVLLIGQGLGAIINVISLIIYLKTEIFTWLLLGFVISCMSLTILYLFYVIKITKLKMVQIKILRQIISFFSSIGLAYILNLFLFPSFLTLVIVLICYFLQLLLFRIISIHDWKFIKEYLKNIMNETLLKK